MQNTQETQKFIQIVADVGIITATNTAHANLELIKTEYGHNFNTLLIRNNSAEELSIKLDGRTIAYLIGGGASFSIDYRDGIVFDDLQITNEDAVADTSANEIRITVGRTGL